MQQLGHEEIRAITTLSESEIKWWRGIIKKVRREIVQKPETYINKFFIASDNTDFIKQKNCISQLIIDIRDATWNMYIEDELKFYRQAIDILLCAKRPHVLKWWGYDAI